MSRGAKADKVFGYLVKSIGVSSILFIMLLFCYLAWVTLPLIFSATAEPHQHGDIDLANTRCGGQLQTAVLSPRSESALITTDGLCAHLLNLATNDTQPIAWPSAIDEWISSHNNVDTAVYGPFGIEQTKFVLRSGTTMRIVDIALTIAWPNSESGDYQTFVTVPKVSEPLPASSFDLSPMDANDSLAYIPDTGHIYWTQNKATIHVLQPIEERGSALTSFSAFRVGADTETRQHERLEPLALGYAVEELLTLADGSVVAIGPKRWTWLETKSGRIQEINSGSFDELDGQIVAVTMLLGNRSFIVGSDLGEIAQWTLRSTEYGDTWRFARSYQTQHNSSVTRLDAEISRKGFWAAHASGTLTYYYLPTSEAGLTINTSSGDGIARLVSSQHGHYLMVLGRNRHWQVYEADNEYPESSFALQWLPIEYEGYEEKDWVWQSTSGSTDWEPKLSFMPLFIGTLKVALYALLFSLPLALFSALYVAQFCNNRLRQVVKPTMELMSALPTVIIGFLAAHWLGPVFEAQLTGVLILFVLLLPWLYLSAWLARSALWQFNSKGFEFVLMIPLTLALIPVAGYFGDIVDSFFSAGSFRLYLDENGIDYQQRNALLVGITMSICVIPTIFSLAEDAFFSVPKNLYAGGLVLGASPWQSVVRIVVPAAMPAVFSAVMIGLGRAVGETMIVLMAAGNTAVTDFNLFLGARPLSANIAVEMPEAELGSTHFRLLFFSALLLLAMTFVINSAAEIIRASMRKKYANL